MKKTVGYEIYIKDEFCDDYCKQVNRDIGNDWGKDWGSWRTSYTIYIGQNILIYEKSNGLETYIIDYVSNSIRYEKIDSYKTYHDLTYYKILVGDDEDTKIIERIDDNNERAFYFVSLLLKFFYEQDREKKELCIYAINVLLMRDVFDMNRDGSLRFLNNIDFLKCIEAIPETIPKPYTEEEMQKIMKEYNDWESWAETFELMGNRAHANEIRKKHPKPIIPKTEEEAINEIRISDGECAFYHYLNEKLNAYVRCQKGLSLLDRYQGEEERTIKNYYGCEKKIQSTKDGVRLGELEIVRYGDVYRLIFTTTWLATRLRNHFTSDIEDRNENYGYEEYLSYDEIYKIAEEMVNHDIDVCIHNAKLHGAVAKYNPETGEFIYEVAINLPNATVKNLFDKVSDAYDEFSYLVYED